MKLTKLDISSIICIVVVLIAFVFSFIALKDTDSLLQVFLNSAAVAGFIGLFAQFFLAIFQNILAERGTRICYLSKDDTFGRQILKGISKEERVRKNIQLSSKLVGDDEVVDGEYSEFMYEYIKKNIRKYDAFIIRAHQEDEITKNMYNYIIGKNKALVGVDWYIELEGKSPTTFTPNFTKGGQDLAYYVKQYCKEKGIEDPHFFGLNCLGNKCATERFNSLHNNLANVVRYRNDDNGERYREVEKNIDIILKNDFANVDILFCGNDNIAFNLMKKLRLDKSIKHKDILFLGYDGVKFEGKYILDFYDYRYCTIDVCPELQGSNALAAIDDNQDLFAGKVFVDSLLVVDGEVIDVQ